MKKLNTAMEKKDILAQIKKILGLPSAMDYKTKDGKVLSVSEDGKTATIDGQPANGSYTLEDGRTVMCSNGMVTGIQEASQAAQTPPPPAPPAPAPAPATQTAEQRLAAIQAQLDTIKAEKEASDKAKAEAEAAKLKAEEESKKQKEALALALKKLEEPVGSTAAPTTGIINEPVAIGRKTDPHAMGTYASRTFIAEHMPWLERWYKDGKYTNKGDGNGRYSDGTHVMDYRAGGPQAVSILETNFNYTWNGVLTTDLFFKPSLDSPALSEFFTIDLGAKDKKRYNLVVPISKVLKPYTGCGSSPTGSRQLITNTTIQLKPFQMYESFCKDDFTGQLSGSFNLLAQEWIKDGNSSFDPAGTPIHTIIMDALKDALRRDVWRRASFADSSSSNADYSQFDGFWQRNIDSSGASNYCIYRAGSALGTGVLGSTVAYDTFLAIYNNSNRLLKQEGIQKSKSTFWVTQSIWENYYTYLVGVGAVTEQAYSDFKSGVKTMEFRGHPIRPVPIWDEDLADSNNPLYTTTRHLVVFTQKPNHILGLENSSDLEKIESWYEMKDQKRYYRSNMIMGYQYLHCDLTSIAY